MAFEQREGQGSLFKNEKKLVSTHADYQGQIMIGGNIYYLNGWVKETKDGKKFFSLSAKVKGQAIQSDAPSTTKQGVNLPKNTVGFPDPFEDSIPF